MAVLCGLSCLLLASPSFAVISSESPPAEYLKADAPPISWMVRMGGDVSIEVPNPKLTLEVGKQLPLFQQDNNGYVAITTDANGEQQLTAFPRYVGNEPAAWVSVESILVFGRRTPSIHGTFNFESDEILPLVRETADDYVVDVQRFNRHMPLTVSKKTPGVVLVPVQKPETGASAAARTGVFTTKPTPAQPPPPPTPEKITAETALIRVGSPAASDASSEMAIAKIKEEFIKDLMGELEKVKQQHAIEDARKVAEEAAKPKPATPPVEAPPAVIVQQVKVPVPAEKETQPEPETQWTFLAGYVHDNAITLLLIAIAAVVLPIIAISTTRMYARKSGARPNAPQAEQSSFSSAPLATEVFTFSSVGESHSTDTASQHHSSMPQPAIATSHGDLSGTLSGHILPQVVQFFCAARESGKMSIRQENGLVEELLFNNGSIIDARTGSIVGKDAARAILQQRDGKFNFHRANTSSDKRLIHDETMSLLLEAHQALDEIRRTRHGA